MNIRLIAIKYFTVILDEHISQIYFVKPSQEFIIVKICADFYNFFLHCVVAGSQICAEMGSAELRKFLL